MPVLYSLSDVETRDHRCVAFAIVQLFHEAFPDGDSFYIPRVITDVRDMFSGRFENLAPIDTRYHDFEHTLQVALCYSRLVVQRVLREGALFEPNDFKHGLVAALLHDTGYLKTVGDVAGTGAKYTRIHEQRSCQYAALYLQQFGWVAERIEAVQNMIRCTGPNADIPAVPFARHTERMLGEAVCAADYVGQMSDPHYVGKLYHLFEEFEESDDYNGVPKKQRAFKDFEELLRKTPAFWEKIVQPRLHVECREWLAHFRLDNGTSPYLDSIAENMSEVNAVNESAQRGFTLPRVSAAK